MSKIIIIIFSFLIVCADSFNFTELRYSDALGKSMKFKGQISFLQHGLSIKYIENKKSLHLQNTKLTYKENGQEITLDEQQAQKITQYFDILILLHSGDDQLIKTIFDVQISSDKTLLKPKGSVSHFITSIELVKEEENLKEIKLFLKNSDTITIKIDNEIR